MTDVTAAPRSVACDSIRSVGAVDAHRKADGMIRTCNIRAVQTDGIQVWAGAVTGVP